MPLAALPDRADAPVSETTERFLRAIVAQVPLADIEELHLFSPLRQGGVETGIAVVAVRPAPVAVETTVEVAAEAEVAAVAEVAAEVETVEEAALAEDAGTAEGIDEPVNVPMPEASEPDPSPYRDEPSDPVVAEAADSALADAPADAPAAPIERHAVYTARYRLVLKGPDRGKWETSLVAEADAPLVTVEVVVRGVQRRAGEASEIVRYSAPQLARAVRAAVEAPVGSG